MTALTPIIKFTVNYIKVRKGFTQYQNFISTQQQFKTEVRQGAVSSPILFNLYSSDKCHPPTGKTLTTHKDDMNPAAYHFSYKVTGPLLQPCLITSLTGEKKSLDH